MIQGQISEQIKITKVADYAAANTTDVTSASVDMSGYDGVLFATSYVTPAANNLIHLEGSSDDSSFSDIAGSEVDLSGASDEDQWVDVINPPSRYVRCIAQRGTSTAMGDIWAIQYVAKNQAVSNLSSGTIYGKALVAPAIGTK